MFEKSITFLLNSYLFAINLIVEFIYLTTSVYIINKGAKELQCSRILKKSSILEYLKKYPMVLKGRAQFQMLERISVKILDGAQLWESNRLINYIDPAAHPSILLEKPRMGDNN